MTIGIRPNTVGPSADLVQMMREVHDEITAAAKNKGGEDALVQIDRKFEPPQECVGVRVRVRYLSEAERVQHADAIEIARNAFRADSKWATLAAVHDAQAAFVARAVAQVDGLSEWDGVDVKPLSWSCVGPADSLPPEAVDILRSSQVLPWLSDVAMHAQGLPAKKAARFGLPPQQT